MSPHAGPRTSSARPEEVTAFVESAFAACGRVVGTVDHLGVAGRVVRVAWAGPALRQRFLPTVQHLLVEASEPDFTISCWDGATAAEKLPPSPWSRTDYLPDARVRGHVSGPLVVTYRTEGRLLQLTDRPGRRALFHSADRTTLPDWHDRAPFRPAISLWADDEGLALLHGATVAQDGVGVVLAGVSGAGKSTTALSCLLEGMDFLGDDACLVDTLSGTVWSLYGRAKLEPDAARRLGDLAGLGAVASDSRGGVLVSPPRVARCAALRAVLLVQVGSRPDSRLGPPLLRQDALDALVETLRVENDGVTRGALAALLAVVDALPVRRLIVGSDPAGVVAAVRDVLG